MDEANKIRLRKKKENKNHNRSQRMKKGCSFGAVEKEGNIT